MTDTTAPQPPSDPVRRRPRGLFWPLVLIGIGLVALLANYGFITGLSVASILALWPVLLILLGVDIAFARRWPVPTLAAEVAIIAGALLLALTQPAVLSLGTFNFNDCDNPTSQSTIARGTLASLALRLDAGGSRFRIVGGATNAVEASADRTQLCVRDRSTGTSGDVRISQGGRAQFGGDQEIVLKVASDLPLSLTVNAGAGDFLIDLHDVKVTTARMSIGAASTTLVLPHPSGDVAIRMDGGASSVVIQIPADVEARITVTGGLVSSNTTNPRASKSGNGIETAGYATAKDRVTVTVTGGATSVSVQ
jgi:cell wall-active antibiotic response 4TMS protein YvqF